MAHIGRAGPLAALAAALLLTVAACTPEGGGTPEPSGSAASARAGRLKLPTDLPSGLLAGLPRSWDELRHWTYADWDRWASAHVFRNPVVRDLWNPDRMDAAAPQQPAPPTVPPTAPPPGDGSAEPDPTPVPAVPVERPYTRYPASGKVFSNAPGGGIGQCSATVVADPSHPGKSNLVWTAAHCVHQGKGGDWFKNIIFVPAYNSSGAASGGRRAPLAEVAPLGQWWADKVVTSPLWPAEGGHSGDAANQYDFAVLRVHDPQDPSKSLEEAIGTAVPVWFDAPREQLRISAWGYPAVKPFNGQELDRCDGGRPTRLSFDAARPAMLTIGCTMTAGASGGGWFAPMPDGRTALVSNTSIGTGAHTTLSGPYLEKVAQQALAWISQK
ncbi:MULTISPECIES: trypsin-like serine peptidase [Kitasatospora]|uniref:V8-like Glu-specific endopeptidase n=1 Tax=Kitasatospora arboriphila TaxID=258052 RepID=A0ABN1TEM3_9ACTN